MVGQACDAEFERVANPVFAFVQEIERIKKAHGGSPLGISMNKSLNRIHPIFHPADLDLLWDSLEEKRIAREQEPGWRILR